jgi:hypothetical protein
VESAFAAAAAAGCSFAGLSSAHVEFTVNPMKPAAANAIMYVFRIPIILSFFIAKHFWSFKPAHRAHMFPDCSRSAREFQLPAPQSSATFPTDSDFLAPLCDVRASSELKTAVASHSRAGGNEEPRKTRPEDALRSFKQAGNQGLF